MGSLSTSTAGPLPDRLGGRAGGQQGVRGRGPEGSEGVEQTAEGDATECTAVNASAARSRNWTHRPQ